MSQIEEISKKASALKNLDYLSICGTVQNHKLRRKIWKKEKRRRKRFIAYLTRRIEKSSSSNESEESDTCLENADVPAGPLTNYSIICYLRQNLPQTITDQIMPKSILLNANERFEQATIVQENSGIKITKEKDNSLTNVENNNLLSPSCIEISDSITNEVEESPDEVSSLDGDHKTSQHLNAVATDRPENEKSEINDLLSVLDDEVEKWQNPLAPDDVDPPPPIESENRVLSAQDIVEDNRPICNFFIKVGACRFGDKCSRKHPDVDISDTLLFQNMFQTLGLDMEERNRIRHDAGDFVLEYSEQDLQNDFEEFYEDIMPEFQQIGRVSELYVCSNRSKHLCGNVYVQYQNESFAEKCFDKMFGRFYNGKPIFCKYVSIASWASAICGIHFRKGSCQRGGQCNFLHVFRKSTNVYSNRYRYSYNNGHNYRSRRFYPKHKRRSRSHSFERRSKRRHLNSRSRSRSYSPESDDESRLASYKKRRKHSKGSPDRRCSNSRDNHRASNSRNKKLSPSRSKKYRKKSSSLRSSVRNSSGEFLPENSPVRNLEYSSEESSTKASGKSKMSKTKSKHIKKKKKNKKHKSKKKHEDLAEEID